MPDEFIDVWIQNGSEGGGFPFHDATGRFRQDSYMGTDFYRSESPIAGPDGVRWSNNEEQMYTLTMLGHLYSYKFWDYPPEDYPSPQHGLQAGRLSIGGTPA